MFSAVESFLFISSSGFSCFCHRVCSRTRKPQKVLISTNFFEVLRFNLILSTFLSIPCAQDTTLIKQCSKVSPNTYHWSLKVVLLFLEAKLLLRYQVAFSQFPSNGNRQQRAVFYLESFLLISGISGFSFFAMDKLQKLIFWGIKSSYFSDFGHFPKHFMCSGQNFQGVGQSYQGALTIEAYWNLLVTFPVIKGKMVRR